MKFLIILALIVFPKPALALDDKTSFATGITISEAVCERVQLGDKTQLEAARNGGKAASSKVQVNASIINDLKIKRDDSNPIVKAYDSGFLVGILRCAHDLLLLPAE